MKPRNAELWMLLRIDWISLPSGWRKGSKDMAKLENEVEEDTVVAEPEEEDPLGAITVMK